jgi:hypothetical protein
MAMHYIVSARGFLVRTVAASKSRFTVSEIRHPASLVVPLADRVPVSRKWMALVWPGWKFGCPRLRQGRIVSDRLPAQNRYGHAVANCDVAWDRQSVTNQEQLPPSPFRDRAVSYLEVPATDSVQSSKFYRQVFGWVVSGDGEQGSFTDGSGHVIGHWRTDLEVAGDRHTTANAQVDSARSSTWPPTSSVPMLAPRLLIEIAGVECGTRWHHLPACPPASSTQARLLTAPSLPVNRGTI